jgi:hypothetical protein
MTHCSSYVKTILSYFQTLDIAKLRLYLKEDYTYQDTTKEIFLNEIEDIFKALHNSGDTEILLYPGYCGATSDMCDNCGKKGYRMVGNKSGNHIDLIFEIENDDIKDIFDCSRFESEKEINNLNQQATIYIALDYKVTFKKTPEYWSKLNAANRALEEIITTPPSLIDFETLCYWVDKNSIVNKLIGGDSLFSPIMKWTPFTRLFFDLSEIRCFLQEYIVLLTEANKKISHNKTEEDIIDWLLEYELVYEKAPYEIGYNLIKVNDYCILVNKEEIHFEGQEFISAVIFFEYYNKQYYPLLEKYSTYTNKEIDEAYNDFESQKKGIDITSLRFHIEKRKALKEIGITIPFYFFEKDE